MGIPYGQALERVRGLANPLLIRATRSPNYDIRQTLVISGFPRSGTTWLAELVAALPKTALLFEPLDFRAIREARKAGFSADNFRVPGERWPEGEAYLRRVLTGRVLTSWTTSHITCSRALDISRWVVKFVRANQLLGWIVANFDIPPPVLLVRHPCAVYSSWVSRGWPLASYAPPAKLHFFQQYPQHLDWVRSLTTLEEFFAARWCMHHVAPLDQLRADQYHLCFYEKMILDGAGQVRNVFAHWNLEPPADLDAVLGRPSAKASESFVAGSTRQIDSWRRKLDSAVIDRMLRVLERFGLDFYTSEALPDESKVGRFGAVSAAPTGTSNR